jgi:hypothetical protein
MGRTKKTLPEHFFSNISLKKVIIILSYVEGLSNLTSFDDTGGQIITQFEQCLCTTRSFT